VSELLNPLARLAKRFKGFLGFAAFVLLVIVVLFLWLFSEGSFDPLIENFSQLEREQFFWFAMTALVLLFLSVLFLVVLAYKSSPLPSGDRGQAVVYVVVHEKGDKTRVISDAEVVLALPEPARKRTQNSGSASFTIPGHFIGRQIAFNAVKSGYKIRGGKSSRACPERGLRGHLNTTGPVSIYSTPATIPSWSHIARSAPTCGWAAPSPQHFCFSTKRASQPSMLYPAFGPALSVEPSTEPTTQGGAALSLVEPPQK